MKTRFLVMDVDGTLTDGRIYMGSNGELMKAFNIKDGCGIHDLLPKADITPIIITGRQSEIVANRCKEIGIKHLFQGVVDKTATLERFLEENGSDFSEVAYAGDDLNDLSCIHKVKEKGGIIGVPANACQAVKNKADFISDKLGGDGAVRDFIEFLVFDDNQDRQTKDSLEDRCYKALEFLSQLKEEDLTIGKHDVTDCFFYNVQEYETKVDFKRHFESHLKYVDIQMLVSGEEYLQVVDINRLQVETPYDESKERILYHPMENGCSTLLRPGSAIILYPKDAHRTIACRNTCCKVKKIVGKVLIR